MEELTKETIKFYTSILPFLTVIIPILGSFIILFAGDKHPKLRNTVTVITTGLTFFLVVLMYPTVITKGMTIKYNLPTGIFGTGLKFLVDPVSLLFATITSLVWFLTSIYLNVYMSHEHKQTRFYFFLTLILGCNLGVVLTADFFSLFIFFEGLGLFAYPLVIHSETKEALAAGTKYLLMTVVGGLLLLTGILLLYYYSGSYAIAPALESLKNLGYLKFVIAGFIIAGFGVKAGMIPLHIWLPDAHPVAPTPGSALLSGIMIKAGAYGIIRVVGTIFRPGLSEGSAKLAESLWHTTSSLGYAILWIGIVTMFLGSIMALLQDNAKRLLAYSSVSQMGYILLGVGTAAYLGEEGALGFAGSMYHIINHALFKSTLFLVIGAVYFRTHELDLRKLGGLWRKMPLMTAFAIIAAFGVTGIPFFNGFASKTLLHESVVEAYKHSGFVSFKIAEIMYIITSGFTFAYFTKFIYFAFFGKPSEKLEKVKEAPLFMSIPLAVSSGLMLLIGLFPTLILRTILTSVVKYWHLSLEPFKEVHYFTVQNFAGVVPVLVLGSGIFLIAKQFDLFHLQFPKWLSIDYWYQTIGKRIYVIAGAFDWLNTAYQEKISLIGPKLLALTKAFSNASGYLSRSVFAVMVDMWLPSPMSESELYTVATETVGHKAGKALSDIDGKVLDRLVGGVASVGQKASGAAAYVDMRLVDKAINGVAGLGKMASNAAGIFDHYVIDNLVNAVGVTTKLSGRKLRPLQTGDVQSYAILFLTGAAVLLIAIMLIMRNL